MTYQEFINAVTCYQTGRVKALNLPGSSFPSLVPAPLHPLLADIIHIIEEYFEELSFGNAVIKIFGLQPTALRLQKSYRFKNKHSTAYDAEENLYSILYYLPLSTLNQTPDLTTYKSIIVNFANGMVMNSQHYIHLLGKNTSAGKIYGYINPKKLVHAWSLCH